MAFWNRRRSIDVMMAPHDGPRLKPTLSWPHLLALGVGAIVGTGILTLIGIGAVVLNGANIGKHCLVGAGALVTEGKTFPDGSMIIGSPAKAVRQLTPEQIEGLRQSARNYIQNARRFKAGLKKIA